MVTDPVLRIEIALRELESARRELEHAIRLAEVDGLSQRRIAEIAGMSQGAVWRILRDYQDTRSKHH